MNGISVLENTAALTVENEGKETKTKMSKQEYEKVLPTNEENEIKVLTIDEYIQHAGQIGRFQIVVMVICSFLFVVPACQALLLVFIAPSPPWRCTGVNDTCSGQKVHYEGQPGFNSRCSMERSQWIYDSPKSHSIVSEFDLVCSKESLAYLANSALFIGQIIGGFVNGWISDKYGRKNVLFSCSTVMCLLAFAASFSPNIYVFIVLRIFTGYCISGVIISVICVSVELVGAKYRALAGLFMWNMWTVGICLMSLQSYYIPDWRHLSMVLSIPYIIFNAGMVVVPESIRWYHSQGRNEDTLMVLKKVSKWNNKAFPNEATLEPYRKNDVDALKKDNFLKWSLSSWRNLRKTVIYSFLWFSNDCIYYGISLAFSDLGGSRHRDFVIIASPEIIANLGTIYIIERMGRKRSVLLGNVVTATGLITFGILHLLNYRHLATSISVGMIGKVFILFSFCGVQIWSMESFPTCIRSQAMGLFYVMSQIGASFAPWVAKGLIRFHATLPFFVLAGLPVCGFLFSLVLKETKGQNIEAGDDVYVNDMTSPEKDKEVKMTKC